MVENRMIAVYRELDNADFCIRLSSVSEKNRISIDSGVDHLKHYAIIDSDGFLIGIRHEIGGPYPIVKYSSNKNDMFIGVDNKLISVSLVEKRTLWILDLDTPFIDMLILTDSNSIIVIEEGGVSRFNRYGDKDWFCGTDFVEHYLIDSDFIIISQADSGKIKISTQTGKKLKEISHF